MNKINKKISKGELDVSKRRGFSLVELLVSMFIFSLIILTSVTVFSKMVIYKREIKEDQKTSEELRTVMEMMAKNIRMSTIKSESGSSIIIYNNSQAKCIQYASASGKISVQELAVPDANSCDSGAFSAIDTVELFSENAVAKFSVVDSSEADKRIGRVAISLSVGDQLMQTTVSLRDYKSILD